MIRLPTEVYSADQLGVLSWELEQVVATARQNIQRSQIMATAIPRQAPTVSEPLAKLLDLSEIDMTDIAALEAAQVELYALRDIVPSVHILLPTYADSSVRSKIVTWLRQEIHPAAMCSFATRTDIGGGFILRTKARQYDMTFRTRLINGKSLLSGAITRV